MLDLVNISPDVTPTRALHLLTTDILLSELISGRPIATDTGYRLVLHTVAARGVLSWYCRARAKWAGNVMMPDCEAIIASISATPDHVPSPVVSGNRERRVLRLTKIVAHRFAGLHAYGGIGEPSKDFVFESSKASPLSTRPSIFQNEWVQLRARTSACLRQLKIVPRR